MKIDASFHKDVFGKASTTAFSSHRTWPCVTETGGLRQQFRQRILGLYARLYNRTAFLSIFVIDIER